MPSNEMAAQHTLRYEVSPRISNRDLNVLYADAWPNHSPFDFGPVLKRSLPYICAFEGRELVGFTYLAWDGSQHAFLLEPTVATRLRHRGIGKGLVRRAVQQARRRRLAWVHVDYESRLGRFYRACGFVNTRAGLINLQAKRASSTPRGRSPPSMKSRM